MRSILILTLGFALALCPLGCGEYEPEPTDVPSGDGEQLGGKVDSGWLGTDTYEVNALVRSTAQQEAVGEWADLGKDAALQARLVDEQIKFIKNNAESNGWRVNQLADEVSVISIDTLDDNLVVIEYEAVVDMLGRLKGDNVPALDELDVPKFVAAVPLDPVGFDHQVIQDCSKTDDGHSAAAYNFHYYFAPDLETCTLKVVQAEVEITEVFERPTVYPEYDALMQPLGDDRVGFRAALVPNRGDQDPMSRFQVHADMLEGGLGLEGKDSEDGTYRRYTWDKGEVTMVIDLYDPTKAGWGSGFAESFRERLSEYTLIHYNGHSSYGTKHLLDEPESFSDEYQIIMIHSCQSYAYYTRQVFRAKATVQDPSGFALADVVATGKSSYPSGSPPTLRVLLDSLMDGMVAIDSGEPKFAPDWLTITERMTGSTWGDIMYGVAGVRTNSWQSTQQ